MNQSLSIKAGADPEFAAGAPDIGGMVEQQEWLERWVPRGITAAIVGIPLLINILHDGTLTLTALLSAGICYLVAKVAIWLVRSLLLYPLHRHRYERASRRLKALIGSLPGLSVGPFSWSLYAPGGLGLQSDGSLVAIDRSTNYQPLIVPAGCVAGVRVKSDTQLVTDTRHSGRSIIGGAGGTLGAGYMSGGRSVSTTRHISEHFLEVQYQLAPNGPIRTLIVPGGGDDQIVHELCSTIQRICA